MRRTRCFIPGEVLRLFSQDASSQMPDQLTVPGPPLLTWRQKLSATPPLSPCPAQLSTYLALHLYQIPPVSKEDTEEVASDAPEGCNPVWVHLCYSILKGYRGYKTNKIEHLCNISYKNAVWLITLIPLQALIFFSCVSHLMFFSLLIFPCLDVRILLNLHWNGSLMLSQPKRFIAALSLDGGIYVSLNCHFDTTGAHYSSRKSFNSRLVFILITQKKIGDWPIQSALEEGIVYMGSQTQTIKTHLTTSWL